MRELTCREIRAVSGGVISPEKVIAVRALGPNPTGAALAFSFYVGYQIGTAIYNTYTSLRY